MMLYLQSKAKQSKAVFWILIEHSFGCFRGGGVFVMVL